MAAHKRKFPAGELQALRIAAGLSQRAASARIGMAERTIGDWESGRRQPALLLWQWLELAEAYGVSIMALNRAIEKDFPRNSENRLTGHANIC